MNFYCHDNTMTCFRKYRETGVKHGLMRNPSLVPTFTRFQESKYEGLQKEVGCRLYLSTSIKRITVGVIKLNKNKHNRL